LVFIHPFSSEGFRQVATILEWNTVS